jgi:glycerate 2-kinase
VRLPPAVLLSRGSAKKGVLSSRHSACSAAQFCGILRVLCVLRGLTASSVHEIVPNSRDLLKQLYEAAVAGAATGPVTTRAVRALGIPRDRRVWLFAFGKAAHAMAGAATAALQRDLNQIVGGLIVAPNEAPSPYGTIAVMAGDHPLPGPRSFAAAQRIGELAARMKSGDVALVLVSGGATSLIAAPLRGMSETELTKVFELLLASGLDIGAVNAVRRRFTRWGGGRLALAISPAAAHCLAVSDVPGDDLATIGSGPSVPDPTTADEVIDILEDAKLFERLPKSFRTYATDVSRGAEPETPKVGHPAFAHGTAHVIANNRGALDAAAERARALGAGAVYVVDAPLLGEAAPRGEAIARWLIELRAKGSVAAGTGAPRIAIWGGETTVTLQPNSGRATKTPAPSPAGGRCQELALAAARTLHEAAERAAGISLLAAGTDGRDGTTDAAGAFVDATTWSAIQSSGSDPAGALERHDANAALAAVGALFSPGATGTNVMDVVIGVIDSP